MRRRKPADAGDGAPDSPWKVRGKKETTRSDLRGPDSRPCHDGFGEDAAFWRPSSPGVYPGRTPNIHVKVFSPDGRERLTTQIYLTGVSEQIADSIFRPELLARDLPPDAEGRRAVAFDIFVAP